MFVNAAAAANFEIGKNYFIRTVTHSLTGKLIEVYPTELVLLDGAWIADDGRLADALKTGKLSEVEPVGDAIVNLAAITDAFLWNHSLPTSQI